MSDSLKVDEVVKIIIDKTKYTEEEIKAMIQETVDSMDNMVTEEGAAYVVADNLGVSLEMNQTTQYFTVDQLVPGQSNISILGRVKKIYSPRSFSRKDGSSGKVMNVELVDTTGSVRMAIWDTKCDLIQDKNIAVGDIIRVTGVNTKAGRENTNELSLGLHGMIDKDTSGEFDETLPEIQHAKLVEVGSITKAMGEVSLHVKIIENRGIYEFERDGKKGKVLNVALADPTGTIQMTAWHESADKVNELGVGDSVYLSDLRVGENKFGDLQVTFSDTSVITPKDAPELTKIKTNTGEMINSLSELAEGGKVSIVAKVIDLGEKKVFEKDGESRAVQSISVMDATAVVRVTFWGNEIDQIANLEIDQIVELGNCKARLNSYSNEIELTFSNSSTLKINAKVDDTKFNYSDSGISLDDITEVRRGVTVKGYVTRVFDKRDVSLSDGREAQVLNITIQDTNGNTAKVAAWDDVISKLDQFSENDGILMQNVKVKPASGEYDPEISLFKNSVVSKLKLTDLGPLIQTADSIRETQYEKTALHHLVNDSRVRISGTIVNVFRPTFYDGCSECNRKVMVEDGSSNGVCSVHGETTIHPKLIITLTLDDTNATVKVKFFHKLAEKLIESSAEDAKDKIDRLSDHKAIIQPILMKEIWVDGVVKYDSERDEQSINASQFGDFNLDEGSSEILGKYDGF